MRNDDQIARAADQRQAWQLIRAGVTICRWRIERSTDTPTPLLRIATGHRPRRARQATVGRTPHDNRVEPVTLEGKNDENNVLYVHRLIQCTRRPIDVERHHRFRRHRRQKVDRDSFIERSQRQTSRASRMPMNCHCTCGGKKLRYVRRICV